MKHSRISPYEQWIPQFNDGSGWNMNFKPTFIYYYEEIGKVETNRLKKQQKPVSPKRTKKNILYKIVCLVENPQYYPPDIGKNHKNTYFVKGRHIGPFLRGFSNKATNY